MGPKQDWRQELSSGLRGLADVLEQADEGSVVERTLKTLGRAKAALHDPAHPLGQFVTAITGEEDEGEHEGKDGKPASQ